MRSLVCVPRPPDGNPVVFLILSHTTACVWTTEDARPPGAGGRTRLGSPAHARNPPRRSDDVRIGIVRWSKPRRPLSGRPTPQGAFAEPQPSWERYTGHPFDVHRDFGWLQAIHPGDRDAVRQAWQAARDSGQVYRTEGRLWHAESQSHRHFIGASRAGRSMSPGCVSEWVGTCTDVEEQHAAAEALRIVQEELLESERVARTESERANRLKDEFLATLSHELRTPLNAILGWAIADRQRVPAWERMSPEAWRRIQRNAKAQAQMIEDLLDMSRITTGKVHARDAARGCRLRSSKPPSSPCVQPQTPKGFASETLLRRRCAHAYRGDPGSAAAGGLEPADQRRQVHPEGRATSRSCWNRVGAHARLSVSDTGQGIAPDFLPLVFDRFRQEDASTTRKHGGLGLGLAIVWTLVELHGGTVNVESAGENQGATFVVDLPLSPDRAERKSKGAFVPSAATEHVLDEREPHGLAGVKVVFVDDDLDSRELVQRVLTECGAQVWTAQSSA